MKLFGREHDNASFSYIPRVLSRQAEAVDNELRENRISQATANGFHELIEKAKPRYPRTYNPSGLPQAVLDISHRMDGFYRGIATLGATLKKPFQPASSRLPSSSSRLVETELACIQDPNDPAKTILRSSYGFSPIPYRKDDFLFPTDFGASATRSTNAASENPTPGFLSAGVGENSGLLCVLMSTALGPSQATIRNRNAGSEQLARTLSTSLTDEIDFAMASLLQPDNPEEICHAIRKALLPAWLTTYNANSKELRGRQLFDHHSGASIVAAIWYKDHLFVASTGLNTLLRVSTKGVDILAKPSRRNILEEILMQSQLQISPRAQNLLREAGSLSGLFFADQVREIKATVSFENAHYDDLNAEDPLLVFFDGPGPDLRKYKGIDWGFVARRSPSEAVMLINTWLDSLNEKHVHHVAAFRCPSSEKPICLF